MIEQSLNNITTLELHKSEAAERTPPRARYAWIVALLAVLAYVNTLPNGYCYDDVLIVEQNPLVTQPDQWSTIWTTDYWSSVHGENDQRDMLYRPLALSTYRMVYAIAGHSPWWQHLVNVLLHGCISVLILRLGFLLGLARSGSLLAGLLFALLPIHTEAATSIVGRADLMATLGIVAALLLHDKVNASRSVSGKVCGYALVVVMSFIALTSKEAGLAVIPLVILFDAYRQLSKGDTFRLWFSRRTAVRLLYLLIPLTIYLGLRYHALDGRFYQEPPLTKTVNVLVDAPFDQHVWGVLQLWGMYWVKTIWPAVLSVKYSINAIRLATSFTDLHVLIGAFIALFLVAAAIHQARKKNFTLALLTLALLISYFPTSNAVVLIRVFLAERIWYLPSVWVVFMAGFTLQKALVDRRRVVLWPLLILVLSAMLGRCLIRNTEWRNNGTLYAAAVRDQPNGVSALHLYGDWLVHHNNAQLGIEHLQKALAIDLGNTLVHRSLGQAYATNQRWNLALHHWQLADQQVPGHAATVRALQDISNRLVQNDQLLQILEAKVQARPEDIQAELALVGRLRNLGLVDRAVARFEKTEPTFQEQSQWHYEFAVTLIMKNRLDESIESYLRSLSIDPNQSQTAVELAMLLLERRRGDDLDQAKHWADHALQLAPKEPNVFICQAEIMAHQGDLKGAREKYRFALQRLPPDSVQRRVVEQRARTLGLQP